uniref:Uncharacterized protein n=1 Tax=Rhizophora mucronata TaxID=61149 RepID=A0A2P2PH82_RHIMU
MAVSWPLFTHSKHIPHRLKFDLERPRVVLRKEKLEGVVGEVGLEK